MSVKNSHFFMLKMSKFSLKRRLLQKVLLHYFILKKVLLKYRNLLIEVYGDHAPLDKTCKQWFYEFIRSDFNMSDEICEGAPRKILNAELLPLLDEDSCRSLEDY